MTIAFIGFGASATLVFLHLQTYLHNLKDIEFVFIEKSAKICSGMAYSTHNANHLLNVRAGMMSAFEDKPKNFVEWLHEHNQTQYNEMSFVPRMLYGQYLNSLFHEEASKYNHSIKYIADEALDIEMKPFTGKFKISFKSNKAILADYCILATGNLKPYFPILDCQSGLELLSPNNGLESYYPVTNNKPVIIIGSGLSCADACLALLDSNPDVKIIVISKSGKLPLAHQQSLPVETTKKPTFNFKRNNLNQTFSYLKEAYQHQGVDFVINELALWRELSNSAWKKMPLKEKERFYRHVASLWQKLRHRMPPQTHEMLQKLIDSEQLIIKKGRVEKIMFCNQEHYVISLKNNVANEIVGQLVINCSEPPKISSKQAPLIIKQMAFAGLLKFDETGRGIVINKNHQIVNKYGKSVQRIYALGPILKGQLFETTAIPEIRKQAKIVSSSLYNTLLTHA